MLEDMNVRGATAFALLVQNADEFDAAVKDIANSAGEATQMADIQQQSLAMQIQRVKNALMAPFLLSDPIGEANDTLNEFTLRIKELVDEFTQFFIIMGPDGQETYSDHGQALKEFVIVALNEAVTIIRMLKDVFLEQNEGFGTFTDLLHYATAPLKMMLTILDFLGPSALKWFTIFKAITMILPINTLMMSLNNARRLKATLNIGLEGSARVGLMTAIMGETAASGASNVMSLFSMTLMDLKFWAIKKQTMGILGMNTGIWMNTVAWVANHAAMLGPIAAVVVMYAVLRKFVSPMQALIITLVALAAAWVAMWAGATLGVGAVVAIAAMVAGVAAVKALFPSHSGEVGDAPTISAQKFNEERNYDLGGTFMPANYDNGGMSTEHGMAVLQKGETVVPKTQNMMGGGENNISMNFGDIHAQDGTDFAEKVASALPDALRKANDQGAV
jgi:hypothetical protein